MFEQESPGVTHSPVETCYPFLDLRIVNYLLAIPPFPWFFQKRANQFPFAPPIFPEPKPPAVSAFVDLRT